METEMEMESIQVVNLDHYMSAGGREPIIRIYGSNQKAETTLLHIHGVYPYLYFRPHSITNTFFEDASPEQMSYYEIEIKQNIEDGVNKRRTEVYKGSKRKPIVHKVEFVEKTSMYGYQADAQVFARVWFRNPADLSKIVTVLEEGEVLKQTMQPYESHIPYLLQFFLDYEIYGMGWLHISKDRVLYRKLATDMEHHPTCNDASKTVNSRDNFFSKQCSGVTENITMPEVSSPPVFEKHENNHGRKQLGVAVKDLSPVANLKKSDSTVAHTPPTESGHDTPPRSEPFDDLLTGEYFPSGETLRDDEENVCRLDSDIGGEAADKLADKLDTCNTCTKVDNVLEGFSLEDIFTQSVLAMNAQLSSPSLPNSTFSVKGEQGLSSFEKTGTCALECDICGEDILNASIAERNERKDEKKSDEIRNSAKSAVTLEPKLNTLGTINDALSSSASLSSPASLSGNHSGSPSNASFQSLSCVRSLKELWDEERCRRIVKGRPEELGDVHTPPATQTRHRPLRDTELEFACRLKNLVAKGVKMFGVEGSVPSQCLSSDMAVGRSRSAVNMAILNSQRERDGNEQKYESQTEVDKVSQPSLLLTPCLSGSIDSTICNTDHDPKYECGVSKIPPDSGMSQYDGILSQYTSTVVSCLHTPDSPSLNKQIGVNIQHSKHLELQQDIERLSGLMPEEDDDDGINNEVHWHTQTALNIVEEIHSVQTDNDDIIQFNKNYIDKLSGDDSISIAEVEDTVTHGGVPPEPQPVLPPLHKRRKGIISRKVSKPPLDGRLGRLMNSGNSGSADTEKKALSMNSQKSVNSDPGADFGLIDAVDKKRKQEKKSENKKKRKKVEFATEQVLCQIEEVNIEASEPTLLTPDHHESFNVFNSPSWTSPLPKNSPLTTVSAVELLAAKGVIVLTPSFSPPRADSIGHFNHTSGSGDGGQEELGSHCHIVPFYSRLIDKDIVTGVGNTTRRRPGAYGWRPSSIKHGDELPPFGSRCEEAAVGTLESCLGATISETYMPFYRVHNTGPRCLVPTISPPPSYCQVVFDFTNHSVGGRDSKDSDFLTPPSHNNDLTVITKVRNRLDQAYKSPRKSQLATPTQTQPKKNLAMKVDQKLKQRQRKEKKSILKSDSSTNDSSPVCTSTSNASSKSSSQTFSRLKTFSMELFASCTGSNLPNPKLNSVNCIFYIINEIISTADSASESFEYGVVCLLPPSISSIPTSSSSTSISSQSSNDVQQLATHTINGKIINATADSIPLSSTARGSILIRGSGIPSSTKVHIVSTEIALFERIVEIVRESDPDFLAGYEVQNSSWGYLIERALHLVDTTVNPHQTHALDMLQLLSRVPNDKASVRNDHDSYGQEHDSGIWIIGRTVLNLWRRMRAELKLSSYTMSSVSSHLLQKSFPDFSHQQLSRWFKKGTTIGMVVNFLYRKANLNLVFIDKLDFIRRTAASARLYGIDFYSAISRGSQYRVEAVMLRVAHRKGFIAMSPSKSAVACQAPMEVIPLVLEPHSNFYVDPVIVLDFQSLYPSMIIAYNLCFSTIMGKMRPGTGACETETTGRLGAMAYPEEMSAYSLYTTTTTMEGGTADPPYVAPNGSVFCPKTVRHGILPLMLKEILETRLMVKRSMKLYKNAEDDILHRVLDARQLALKMIANVTYGYTAAGFSGRMPMAELADAIVQCGRTTLEWVITEVESNPTWDAKVVYGDTDSVFVHLKGRTKADAFRIGAEIAHEITRKSPVDVLLKMEKVYLPSVLVSKKRYVGNAFEDPSPHSTEVAHFDAKGIEVVRRDQCGATVKIQEKALRLLFETKDLSIVKEYLYKQWTKIHEGGDQLPLQDFIFRKEVKLGHYATDAQGQPRSLPPGALVASEAIKIDPRAEPPYKWRVPYVVVSGDAGARLKDLVVPPERVLRRGSILRVNHLYYITKHINPALERVLNFAGIDITYWYKCMKHPPPKIRQPFNLDLIMTLNGQSKLTSSGNVTARRKKIPAQTAITDFMGSLNCVICGMEEKLSNRGRRLDDYSVAASSPTSFVCSTCKMDPAGVLCTLHARMDAVDARAKLLQEQCRSCMGSLFPSQFSTTMFDNDTFDLHSHCAGDAVSESKRFAGRGLVNVDGCVALDCPVQFSRCQYLSRCEDVRVTLAHFTISNPPGNTPNILDSIDSKSSRSNNDFSW